MHRIASIPARRRLIATTALSLVALLATLALAQEAKKPAAQPNAGPAQQPAGAAPARSGQKLGEAAAQPVAPEVGETARKPVRSPMVTEMMALIDQQDGKLKDLAGRLKKATSNEEAFAIKREIEQVKLGTEVSLLRVQADYARRDGRTADADRLDAAIRALLTPPRPGTPVNRPVPVRDAQQH